MKGFIVYSTYRVEDEKAYVHLYGRLENGESFKLIKKFKPYFWIRSKDEQKAKKLMDLNYGSSQFKNFDDEPVTKVTLDNPRNVPKIRDLFKENNIISYESDVRFVMRFLIDNDIHGSIDIEGDHEKSEKIDRIYKEPKIKPAEYFPELRILSFDIETSMDAKEIYCISMYTKGFKKALIVKEGNFDNTESFKNETAMLQRFKEILLKLDPDIITGWNVIDFDLNIIRNKFKELGIRFDLGRDDDECSLNLTNSFFMDSKTDFHGRIVLDGISLMKSSFVKLPDYKLNTAAKEILGEKKLLEGKQRFKEIEYYYKKAPKKLIEYNIKDSILVYDILKKLKLIDLTITRSILTRMQLDRVSASIASLDSLYLKELQKKRFVAPNMGSNDRDERIKGGYVRESKPGIYSNIIVLDFKSLYPSIIRTFNIDPLMFIGKEKKGDYIITPNNAAFKRTEGILPALIQTLWKERDKAKKEKNTLKSNAIKILMNSFFGVLANPMCRFYSLDVANAITYSGQHIIKFAAEKIEKDGLEVIYGDTDSLFINPGDITYEASLKLGKKIENEMNEFLKNYIKKEYKRESALELEFEKVYKRFFMPTVRHSDVGAKKRYAGILVKDGKEKLDFTGLEFVRSDWTEVSKRFQLELLNLIFSDNSPDKYIKNFISELKKGKYDELLVYRKSLRKPTANYTKTTPPHVKAARKMDFKGTGTIEYIMTINGPEPIEMLKSPVDYDHYIEKQLKPIADSVLAFFDKSFDDLIKGSTQKGLMDF